MIFLCWHYSYKSLAFIESCESSPILLLSLSCVCEDSIFACMQLVRYFLYLKIRILESTPYT
ncbi:hypothetical protein, partial [Helicobacter typhlonius]|uniref:hypothetical protein n=1 Tax=Helicobacter typhlonius TaxID=76936 RepID=UPI002FE2E9BE